MRVDQATPELVYMVAGAMRERDLEEFSAVLDPDDRETMAIRLASVYGLRHDTFVMSDDTGPPIAVVGTLQTRPRSITMLFFATDAFPAIALPATRMFKQHWLPGVAADGVHRIECVSLKDYRSMHRWLEILGFQPEAEHPNYGKRGETFITFAWTPAV